MKYELYPFQRDAVDFTLNGLVKRQNPLISLPTGMGKSLVCAGLIKEALQHWPTINILVLAHRKELLTQNAEKLMHIAPEIPFGIYSAGLRSSKVRKVTIAGIQSIYNKAHKLPPIQLVIVDEAHLIPMSGEGRYQTLFKALRKEVPNMLCVGLTATPYRTGGGMLYGPDRLFSDISYEATIQWGIENGYLSPITTKFPKDEQPDLTGVRISAGEYHAGQVEERMVKVTVKAVERAMYLGRDRKKWLVFASGVEHAKLVASLIPGAEIISGDTPAMFRDKLLADFKTGKIKCLVNCDVLTTGFDEPSIDLVVLLRATYSPGLYVQMVGRGTRKAPEKRDCLVLDFGRNVDRFGPIDSVTVVERRHSNKATALAPPFKLCPDCMTVTNPRTKICECGYQYPSTPAIGAIASSMPILNAPVEFEVREIKYSYWQKDVSKTPTMRVDYINGYTSYSEWVCLEHDGFARQKAVRWWRERDGGIAPGTIRDAVLSAPSALKRPAKIRVIKEGKYWRVAGVVQWFNPKHVPAGIDARLAIEFLEKQEEERAASRGDDDDTIPF
jgi:DNA repair protein RadD